MQYRFNQAPQFRADLSNRMISGYGVVYNSDSAPMAILNQRGQKVKVVERITADSMRGADMSDVISSYNHNFEKILGRSTSGTLFLQEDENGISYHVTAGNQSYANDTLESIQRGDVSGSSFVFLYDVAAGYDFEERTDGTIVATIKSIKKVIEMGPVISPAYPGTTAENRSSDLLEAAKRFLSEKDETTTPVGQVLDEVTEEGEAKRAIGVFEMAEIVEAAFYSEFDYTDDSYYYVQSIMVDDTLVAQEYPSKKLFKVEFSIAEDQSVTFTPKENWVLVQKEYVPVSRFFEEREAQKREKDGTTEKTILKQPEATKRDEPNNSITYPFPSGYWKVKAKTIKRV